MAKSKICSTCNNLLKNHSIEELFSCIDETLLENY